MRSMSLLVGSAFPFLSPLLSLGSSDRSHNSNACNACEIRSEVVGHRKAEVAKWEFQQLIVGIGAGEQQAAQGACDRRGSKIQAAVL